MLLSYWTLGALKNSVLITSVDSHVHHNTVVRYSVCLLFFILNCLSPYYCICFSPTQLRKRYFSILTFQQGWGQSSLMFGFGWNKLKKAMFLFEFIVSFKNQVVSRIPPPTCWCEGKLYNLEKTKDVINEIKWTAVVGAVTATNTLTT